MSQGKHLYSRNELIDQIKHCDQSIIDYVGINNFCELYRRVCDRKMYDDDTIKHDNIIIFNKVFDPMGDPLNPKFKEWVSMDYLESEMKKIFDDLKDFQILE